MNCEDRKQEGLSFNTPECLGLVELILQKYEIGLRIVALLTALQLVLPIVKIYPKTSSIRVLYSILVSKHSWMYSINGPSALDSIPCSLTRHKLGVFLRPKHFFNELINYPTNRIQ